MEETTAISKGTRCAVVTGASQGIGFEICRQLASEGVTVILTARYEKQGNEAVEDLQIAGLSNVIFQQLDIIDSASIASLEKFIRTHFKKLDILVNNAAETGVVIDREAFKNFLLGGRHVTDEQADLVSRCMKQTNEKAEECLITNFYGTKGVTEALLPLLQLSNSSRIVNVSSSQGQLKYIYNEKVRDELGNIDNLTEEKIDMIVQQFLTDFKNNKLQAHGWPRTMSAYKVSKAALNAYTRVLSKRNSSIIINCVHPGSVKTEVSCYMGNLTPEEGAKAPVMLALLPDGSPSGLHFDEMHPSSF